MVSECGVPDQHFLVPECGNLVADDFGGFRRHHGADGRANLVECAAGGFRDGGKVVCNGLRASARDGGSLLVLTVLAC